ncbi:unnamed protein product, partial [Ectocarpus sp. 8 AP-2014]
MKVGVTSRGGTRGGRVVRGQGKHTKYRIGEAIVVSYAYNVVLGLICMLYFVLGLTSIHEDFLSVCLSVSSAHSRRQAHRVYIATAVLQNSHERSTTHVPQSPGLGTTWLYRLTAESALPLYPLIAIAFSVPVSLFLLLLAHAEQALPFVHATRMKLGGGKEGCPFKGTASLPLKQQSSPASNALSAHVV